VVVKINDHMMTCANEVQRAFCEKKRYVETCADFIGQSFEFHEQFENYFLKECCSKSHICRVQQFNLTSDINKLTIALDE